MFGKEIVPRKGEEEGNMGIRKWKNWSHMTRLNSFRERNDGIEITTDASFVHCSSLRIFSFLIEKAKCGKAQLFYSFNSNYMMSSITIKALSKPSTVFSLPVLLAAGLL